MAKHVRLIGGGSTPLPEGGGEGGPVEWDDIDGKPATFPPTTGTGAAQAAPGNHTHTFTALAGSVAGASGANLQAILADLAARVGVLEAE